MATSPGVGLTFIDSKDIKLGKVLGKGGFGTVYKATHVNWGRVAVKRLLNIRMTESLQKEAEKMLRSLTSPYLVRIMGLIETPNGVDIVMEFFEYGSLKEFEEKYMKCDCWSRKVKMVQDIAYGMNFLHTLKPPITHCDLKLENVFVANGFEAKIGDFGLAVSSTKSRQKAGAAGTVSHMPPEAFDNADIEPDEAWDMYTYAITTYELTTGRDPWPQLRSFANEALVAVWVGKGHRPNLEAIPSDAPTELVDIITSCWVAKPSERPRFINILDSVIDLFETKFERSLRKADRAISEQMDVVQESSESQAKGADSGWGSLEAWSNKEQHQDTVTSGESVSSGREEEASTTDISNSQGNIEVMRPKERHEKVAPVESTWGYKEQHQETVTSGESASSGREEVASTTYISNSQGNIEVMNPKERDEKVAPVESTRGNKEQHQETVTLGESASSGQDEEASTIDNSNGASTADNLQGNLEVTSPKEQHQKTSPVESTSNARVEENSLADIDQGTTGAEGGLGSLEASNLGEQQEAAASDSSSTYKAENSVSVETDKDMQWNYLHAIDTPRSVHSCRWINPKHLAVCMKGCVKVYEVTTSSSHLAYTISSKKWKPLFGQAKEVRGTAVSEALPGSMLVICEDHPYVYQFPCQEATKEITRHKIQGDEKSPNCIVSNSGVAIISMDVNRFFTVCKLPNFTRQSVVRVSFYPRDLSICANYVVVMGDDRMTVRSVAGDRRNLCKIQLPGGCKKFCSVCLGNVDARELYVVCEEDERNQGVYKYIWNESSDGKEWDVRNEGRVIGGLKWMYRRCLSLTSDHRMMAVGLSFGKRVKLYKLE